MYFFSFYINLLLHFIFIYLLFYARAHAKHMERFNAIRTPVALVYGIPIARSNSY